MKTLKYTGSVWWYLALLFMAWANAVPLYILLLIATIYPAMRMGEFGEAELRQELTFFYSNRRMQQVKIACALLLVGFNVALYGLVANWHFDALNFIALLVSTAFSNGTFMLPLAHDFSHSDSLFKRWTGNLMLFTLCLPFFRADHIYGHHELVGTAKDASSARFGQHFYSFIGRTFLQRIRRSYSRRSDLPPVVKSKIRRNNYLFTGLLALFAASLFFVQPLLLLFWLGQSVLVYVLYELTNYAQHYGLRRLPGEAITMKHSWNSYFKYDNYNSWFLFVHSPHHLERPLHKVGLLAGPRMPHLPSKMLLLALIPRAWFRLMNPLVLRMQNRPEQDLEMDAPKTMTHIHLHFAQNQNDYATSN
ncbi:MAG: fatty acid desaturase [Saprospiraceae bacterium]|nr:fatty acid desaturase [Saprospiraceae bacterium]